MPPGPRAAGAAPGGLICTWRCAPGTPARDSPVARFDSRKSALSLAFASSDFARRLPTDVDGMLEGFRANRRTESRFQGSRLVKMHGSADIIAAESHGPNLGFGPVETGRDPSVEGRSTDDFRVR